MTAARLPRGLYAITPDFDDTESLAAKVAAAIDGGARAIQFRNKSAPAAVRRGQAARLALVCKARGALFIVNDDATLARDVAADGVHLGEDDGDLAAARALLGAQALIGVSCYDDFARAQKLVAQGADHVAFGSFFESAVKPGARRAEVSLLTQARTLGVPIVAIGGITADNAPALIRAGTDVIAVISAVFGARDVSAAAARLAGLFGAPRA